MQHRDYEAPVEIRGACSHSESWQQHGTGPATLGASTEICSHKPSSHTAYDGATFGLTVVPVSVVPASVSLIQGLLRVKGLLTLIVWCASDELSDVVLLCEGREFKCHRVRASQQ